MGGTSQGEMRGLTSYIVYKQKEGGQRLLGVPLTLVLAVLLVSVILAITVRFWIGACFGVFVVTTAYGVLAGKPRFWITYGLIYFYRDRSVLVPSAPTSQIWEDRLRVLQRLHQAE